MPSGMTTELSVMGGRQRVKWPRHCADNDPLLETCSSGSRGFVEVEAVLRDGRRETVGVEQPPGHPSRELTWEDIRSRTMDEVNFCSFTDSDVAAITILGFRCGKVLRYSRRSGGLVERCNHVSRLTFGGANWRLLP